MPGYNNDIHKKEVLFAAWDQLGKFVYYDEHPFSDTCVWRRLGPYGTYCTSRIKEFIHLFEMSFLDRDCFDYYSIDTNVYSINPQKLG